MLKSILFVGLGSFLGGALRYCVSLAFENKVSSGFPLATFIVNILGCILIGVFSGLLSRYDFVSSNLKLFLIAGFCGGFTTFSTFMFENIFLLKSGNLIMSLVYLFASLIVGAFCAYFAYCFTK